MVDFGGLAQILVDPGPIARDVIYVPQTRDRKTIILVPCGLIVLINEFCFSVN